MPLSICIYVYSFFQFIVFKLLILKFNDNFVLRCPAQRDIILNYNYIILSDLFYYNFIYFKYRYFNKIYTQAFTNSRQIKSHHNEN